MKVNSDNDNDKDNGLGQDRDSMGGEMKVSRSKYRG